jgi:hypothetical protein
MKSYTQLLATLFYTAFCVQTSFAGQLNFVGSVVEPSCSVEKLIHNTRPRLQKMDAKYIYHLACPVPAVVQVEKISTESVNPAKISIPRAKAYSSYLRVSATYL